MKGMVQSLNISVTAGIVMYEVERQREPTPNPSLDKEGKNIFGLNTKEKRELIKEFGRLK
jgi:hypothetical protein